MKFSLICFLLSGCATTQGLVYEHEQTVYVTQQLVNLPGPHDWDYIHKPINIVVTVHNPRSYNVGVSLDCGQYETFMKVDAHKNKKVMLTRTLNEYYGGDLCDLIEWHMSLD